jgi:hypothetical protein
MSFNRYVMFTVIFVERFGRQRIRPALKCGDMTAAGYSGGNQQR